MVVRNVSDVTINLDNGGIIRFEHPSALYMEEFDGLKRVKVVDKGTSHVYNWDRILTMQYKEQ